MSKTVDTFVGLLRSAITGEQEQIELSDTNFEKLYYLANYHDLAHIVFYELRCRGELSEGDIFRKFKNQFDIALYRHIKRDIAIEQVRRLLENAQIPFVLLKGVVLMELYPEQWMRTSSDIDVLIREIDIQKAEHLFVSAGIRRDHESLHDISFFTEENFHIELHFTLLEERITKVQRRILKDIWDYCEPKEGCISERIMQDEMLYFYHVAHMAKHFKMGGCGIRTFLDLWLLNHRCSFSQEKRNDLLCKGGLSVFENNAKELSEIWFSKKEDYQNKKGLSEYIISGGLYGTSERNIAAIKSKQKSRLSYYIMRIIPPNYIMKLEYPALKKCPFLLPFFWIARWFRLLRPSVRNRIANEIQTERLVNDSEKKSFESLMKELEIW